MPARLVLLTLLLFAALPRAGLANVIWPAAILAERMIAWWAIAASLLIEFLFVWRAYRVPPLKAVLATLAANGASAGLGLFLLPILGILWEAGLHVSGIGIRLNWHTFSPAGWIATFVLAVALNLGIELFVYRFGFKLPVDRRVVVLLLLANTVTAGLAWLSLSFVPHDYY